MLQLTLFNTISGSRNRPRNVVSKVMEVVCPFKQNSAGPKETWGKGSCKTENVARRTSFGPALSVSPWLCINDDTKLGLKTSAPLPRLTATSSFVAFFPSPLEWIFSSDFDDFGGLPLATSAQLFARLSSRRDLCVGNPLDALLFLCNSLLHNALHAVQHEASLAPVAVQFFQPLPVETGGEVVAATTKLLWGKLLSRQIVK